MRQIRDLPIRLTVAGFAARDALRATEKAVSEAGRKAIAAREEAAKRMADRVIVTRHSALVEYLREIGQAGMDTRVIAHAAAEDVRDKVVVGVLPLHLAALAAHVIEVPLDLPTDMRGMELSIEQVRQYAGRPVRYRVGAEHACPECGEFACDGCE